MRRVAVLASGGGSNLQALIDHEAVRGSSGAYRIALVASDRPAAGALQRAATAGIPTVVLEGELRTTGLRALLESHEVDVVVLAGYLRMVPADVTAAWHGRVINVHPALLPAFGGHGMYGRRVHEAVITSGARLSGPTVHFVDERYDEGPIIAQWPVPVLPDDTPESLAARVLEAEHLLLPRVVEAVAAGAIRLDDDGLVVGQHALPFRHFIGAADLEEATRQLTQSVERPARTWGSRSRDP
jgi:formyltetrahydrofolate-dependent phosphoribosylglycinamide formyltransferase